MFEAVARESGLTFAPIAKETGPLFRRMHALYQDYKSNLGRKDAVAA